MKREVPKKQKYPASYLAETNKGIKIRRNRRQLLKTRAKVFINPDLDYENTISLEDLPVFHGQNPEYQLTDWDLEAQQPHRTMRSGSQVITFQ